MIKLFYQDKVIIFDNNNNNNSEKNIIIENYPTVDKILEYLYDKKRLFILCDDIEKSYSHFKKDFKTITAAGGFVENIDNELLMIFRNGKWDLPKGKLEDGENIPCCAIREVEEETGIRDINLEGEPFCTTHFYDTYGQWELKTTYWYKMSHSSKKDITFTPQISEGITSCEWLSSMKVESVIHSSYEAIKEVIKYLKK